VYEPGTIPYTGWSFRFASRKHIERIATIV
jgi:hypothetical protein